MRPSSQIKPLSFVADNADRLPDALDETGDPVFLTRDGEAKAVLMSVHEYERTRDTLAMLKIVALAERDIKEGRTIPAAEAFDQVKRSLRERYG